MKLKGKLSGTIKIIQSSNMPLLEVVQSRIQFFDNFRYTINKENPISIYLDRVLKCGVRMVANPSLTKINKYSGQHTIMRKS